MKTPDEIKKGLKCESISREFCEYQMSCLDCEFYVSEYMSEQIAADALNYIQQLETRGWELFDILSSAWYGKGYYFKQDDGTVYSRASCQYLSFDQAIDEFASALTNAHEVE